MKQRMTAFIIAAGMTASTGAFASQARQLVLGTQDPLNILSAGTHGSLYVDDNMNVFFNPSYLTGHKNWAAIEKVSGIPGTSTAAEGGFAFDIGQATLGFYMNRQDSISHLLGTAAVYGSGTVNQPVRPFDILLAMDTGVKWGVDLSYGSNTRGVSDNSAADLTLRAGAQVAEFEPFVSFKLIGRNTVSSTVENKNSSVTLGTKYRFGEWTPFAVYRTDSYTAQGASSVTANGWGVGFGRNMKMAEGTQLRYGASYWQRKDNSGKATRLPIDLSVETDATAWLTVRAGLSYLMASTAGDTSSPNSDTTGRLGAAFKFGKATLDWAVGSTAGTGQVDGTTFDFANGLFTQASLTYNW